MAAGREVMNGDVCVMCVFQSGGFYRNAFWVSENSWPPTVNNIMSSKFGEFFEETQRIFEMNFPSGKIPKIWLAERRRHQSWQQRNNSLPFPEAALFGSWGDNPQQQ